MIIISITIILLLLVLLLLLLLLAATTTTTMTSAALFVLLPVPIPSSPVPAPTYCCNNSFVINKAPYILIPAWRRGSLATAVELASTLRLTTCMQQHVSAV